MGGWAGRALGRGEIEAEARGSREELLACLICEAVSSRSVFCFYFISPLPFPCLRLVSARGGACGGARKRPLPLASQTRRLFSADQSFRGTSTLAHPKNHLAFRGPLLSGRDFSGPSQELASLLSSVLFPRLSITISQFLARSTSAIFPKKRKIRPMALRVDTPTRSQWTHAREKGVGPPHPPILLPLILPRCSVFRFLTTLLPLRAVPTALIATCIHGRLFSARDSPVRYSAANTASDSYTLLHDLCKYVGQSSNC